MKFIRKNFFLISVLLLVLILAFLFIFPKKSEKNGIHLETQIEELIEDSEIELEELQPEITIETDTEENKEQNIEEETQIPKSIFISVPFTSQAPYAVWDERHEEACEEASLLMIHYYLKEKKLTPEISEKEIQGMIDFQIRQYGDYKDTSTKETVQLAKDYYEINNLKVIYDIKKEDIKKELAKNNPIIIPAAGRLLGNPYFTPPGPLYHNLVLVGYRGDTIITNDPGTKRGEGYEYDIDVLYNAIHDFPGSKNAINSGKKSMIVIDGQ